MRQGLDWSGRPRRSFGIALIVGMFLLFALLENLLEATVSNSGPATESGGVLVHTSGTVDKAGP